MHTHICISSDDIYGKITENIRQFRWLAKLNLQTFLPMLIIKCFSILSMQYLHLSMEADIFWCSVRYMAI